MIVYMYDIIVTGDDSEEVHKLKAYLSSEFEVKDLGTLCYFLGLEVVHSKKVSSYLRESMFWIYLLRQEY